MDMNCDNAINLISSLIDGELSSEDQSGLDAHLAACPGCRATLEALQGQNVALKSEIRPLAGRADAVADAVVRRIHGERVQRNRFRLFPMLLSAAAGFAVALMVFQPWKPRRP